MNDPRLSVCPVPALDALSAYTVGRPERGIDLVLDFNESLAPTPPMPAGANRYPPLPPPLEGEIGALFGVGPDRVLVTCGADDALERAVRAVAAPGRRVLLTDPTYSMIRRFAILAGAEIVDLPWWSGDFPVDEACELAGDDTAVVAVVSPNNPTGLPCSPGALATLLQKLPQTLVIVDQAYVDFAAPDTDLASMALEHPNAVVVRTFSKAWGGAGLRVGYAVGDARVIGWMRRVGLPFPVSQPAIDAVSSALASGPDRQRIDRVRRQRDDLSATLHRLGIEVWPSEASFVLARFTDGSFVWQGLAALGIAVRNFSSRPGLAGCLRITLPGEDPAYARLESALVTVLSPAALIFDMDGVLADVSRSYRAAIVATAASFGVALSPDDIARAKAEGDANNDWNLTRSLLAQRGVQADLAEVTRRFESLYQGDGVRPGLREHERPLLSRAQLAKLASRLPLAVVTGRPRGDAERFLADHSLEECFRAVVTMEDAAAKPDPAPIRLALDRLGVDSAWMVGDTPDDIRAARAAGVLPIAVAAPGEDREVAATTLLAAGACTVLESIDDILEVLP